MAHAVMPEKIIKDIQESVEQLKKFFIESRIPVNDDNTNLHRFCFKLEFLLQNGMKVHTNLLGTRKDYWDYFCSCLTTRRDEIHDGLKFVKSISEIKTSLGRGRAFIRFCLMQQCLADSLQRCFMNNKVTSNWYYETSILLNEAQLSILISTLYELNDIQFDLSPRVYDLDIAWPTFARKQFGSPNIWQPPSRSVSISSLISYTSQNEPLLMQQSTNDTQNIKESKELKMELPCLENDIEELQEQKYSEKREEESKLLEKERELLQVSSDLEEERKSHKISINNLEEEIKKLKQSWDVEKSEMIEKLNNSVRISLEHSDKVQQIVSDYNIKEENYVRNCEELKTRIQYLETENSRLLSESFYLEEELKKHKEIIDQIEKNSKDSEQVITELKNENEMLKTKIKEQNIIIESQFDVTQSKPFKDLKKELRFNETALFTAKTEAKRFQRELEKSEELIQLTNKLVNTLEIENLKLREQINILENNGKCIKKNNDLEKINAELQNEISIIRTELKNALESKNKIEDDFQTAMILPEKLLFTIEKIINSSEVNFEEIINSFKFESTDHILNEKIYLILNSLQKLYVNNLQNATTSSVNLHFVNMEEELINLCRKQTLKIEELQKEFDACIQETLKLNCQMCILKNMLHLNEDRINFDNLQDECSYIEEIEENENKNNNDINDNNVSSSNIPLYEMNNNVIKLNKLTDKTQKLFHDLEAFRDLNHKLISKVQEQERKLYGITQELETTQKLVTSLKLEHNKLQTTEAITRYELKEKRKLLSKLRTQLESTKEECNRMRKNYSNSEAEWQSLRDEFAKRHKQASEESGFVDDTKTLIDNENDNQDIIIIADSENDNHFTDSPSTSSPINANISEEGEMIECYKNLTLSSEGAEGNDIEKIEEEVKEKPKSRLDRLEEDFKLVQENIKQNVSRSAHLEQRVQHLRTKRSNLTNNNKTSDEKSDLSQNSSHNSLDHHEKSIDNSLQLTSGASACALSTSPILHETNDVLEEIIADVSNSSEISEDIEHNSMNIYDPSSESLCDLSDLDEENSSNQESNQEVGHIVPDLRRKVLGNFVTRLRNERIRRESTENELKLKLESLKDSNYNLRKEIEKLEQEKSDLIAKEVDFRKRSEYIFRKERENFHDINVEKCNLEKNVMELTDDLKNALDRINELEKKNVETKEELEIFQNLKKEEISALQFQLSTEALKYEKALKRFTDQESEITTMKKQINEQEELILFFQESLSEIREEREFEKQQQRKEVEGLQLSLSTRDEECTKMNEDYKKTLMELDKERNDCFRYKTELSALKAENNHCTKELEQLRSDNIELRKKVIKLIKEKDMLWKHSEKLAHQQKIQVTDRWMEDTETSTCLGCKTAFSFMVRKHHCRLCGRIFCHNCANHWLLTASSRREARVCSECYIQHVELQAECNSTVPSVTEDSEDDELETTNIINNSSVADHTMVSSDSNFDSENTASFIDSTASLPICCPTASSTVLFSDTLPMYGSLPDLPSLCANKWSSHDNQLVQEKKMSLQEEFDVISDEEIAHSLSLSNPYVQSANPGRKVESRLHTTILRNAVDIKAAGLQGMKGELWVNAGTQYGVPVICDLVEHVLQWEFSTEPKRIGFSLVYNKSKGNLYDKLEMQPLIQTVHIDSSHHPGKGQVFMKEPGVYMLIFDNRFSRVSAKKVKYFLVVKNAEDYDSNF